MHFFKYFVKKKKEIWMRIACWDQQQTWWYSNAVSVIILYFHHRWFSERRYSLNTAKKNREAVFSHTFLKNIIIHVILWEAWERWFALFAFRVKVASDDISFVLRFATGWNGLLKKGKKRCVWDVCCTMNTSSQMIVVGWV